MPLHTYLPQDRHQALAQNQTLPDRSIGSALFADIAGFTPLTEQLRHTLGPRRGAEKLSQYLDTVYTSLITLVEQYGGSVVNFAGDAISCWFDDSHSNQPAPLRAVAAAQAMHRAIEGLADLTQSLENVSALSLKVAVATGPVRRFVVGDPTYQYLDTLAGTTITRMAQAEHLAQKGETLVDQPTAVALGANLTIVEWRTDPTTTQPFGVVQQFTADVAPLPQPTIPPLPPTSLRPWLHDSIYEREQAGQASFLTEFRPCAALFLKFAGIDYDSDEAAAQLDQLTQRVQAITAHYGGLLIDISIGDKGSYLYLNFGALQVHEDNARRTIKTAQAIRHLPHELDWLAFVQMGLTYGIMRVGTYGSQTRRIYSALGDEVNLAARLMEAAVPGEILVSSRIQRQVDQYVTFAPPRLMQFKGLSEPLPVFALMGDKSRPYLRLPEPTYKLPMVGRQAELAQIKKKLRLAQQGQAQTVGIVGEAGIGKSRLVAEVIQEAQEMGFTGYGGACQSDGTNTPYLVWKPIWQSFFKLDSTHTLAKQQQLLAAEVERLAPARLAALPLLSPLLNLDIPENEFTATLTAQERKSARHALLEDCLQAVAQETPLLLIFEDLHWLDALSHDLLEEIVRVMTTQPICFTIIYRPPQLARLQAPRLERLTTFTKIELKELSPAEAEQTIKAKLAHLYPERKATPPTALVQALTKRAEGNPFYLEELLNFLHDRNLDPFNPADLARIELPNSLHSLILSRIDQLLEQEKIMLRVASIIGRLFPAAWLIGYYPDLGRLHEVKAILQNLNELDITALDTPEPELSYLFKHIVIHEVTYESLPFATRARLHEQLAHYLEQAAATNPTTPLLDLIAYHYGQSENKAKQRHYFQKAGDAAQATFANEAALDYLDRLLPLLDEPHEQIALQQQRTVILELIGRYDETTTAVLTALSLAQQVTDKVAIANCQFTLGKLTRLRSQLDVAQTWLAQAITSFTKLDDLLGQAKTYIEMGTVARLQGEYARSHQETEKGLALAEAAGDQYTIAYALDRLGAIAWHHSNYATAQAALKRGLAIGQEIGHKQVTSNLLNNLAIIARRQGEYGTALALQQQNLLLVREIGHKRGEAVTLNNLGLIAYSQETYEVARSFHEQSIRLHQAIGNKRGEAMSYNNNGLTYQIAHDYETAQTLYEQSLAIYQEIGNEWGSSYALRNLGNLMVEKGEIEAAQNYYRQALTISWELKDQYNLCFILGGLAAVAGLKQAWSQAVQLIAAAESLRQQIDSKWEPIERRIQAQLNTSVRAALNEEQFQAAWTAGETMPLAEVVQTIWAAT